jgi:hypothetical protein
MIFFLLFLKFLQFYIDTMERPILASVCQFFKNVTIKLQLKYLLKGKTSIKFLVTNDSLVTEMAN